MAQKKTIQYKELAQFYGVDFTTVSRDWVAKGLDNTAPLDEIKAWVVENYIKPLRTTDTKEQLQQSQLRLTESKALAQEIENKKSIGELVQIADIENDLVQYCTQLKKVMRSIPSSIYLELAAIEEPLILRDKLQEVIDDALREFKYTYEQDTNEDSE
ncbi:hypothetical protein [Cedecea lapagei]|uniref:hypothetical protein n=1 Tax=Cedecea lapagei TaxID=158823 RepID=UPI001BCF3022|nr:hypothetical protein [Cedecea lapagei]